MAGELSQEKLEELVVGKPLDPNVKFFEKAVINPGKSKVAGKRVYDTHLFIQKTYPGVNDFVPKLAQKRDIEKYPREYQLFLDMRPESTSPSVDIIPNLNAAMRAELKDMGLGTVKLLAEAASVPPQYERAQRSARTLQNALEADYGEEEGIEEDDSEEVHQAGPAPTGRLDGGDVHGREPAGSNAGRGTENPEGLQAAGREHGHQREESSDERGYGFPPRDAQVREKREIGRVGPRTSFADFDIEQHLRFIP